MIKAAIENENSTSKSAITKGLANLKNFDGVTGKMSIDKDHNPVKSMVMVGMTDGKESSAVVVK